MVGAFEIGGHIVMAGYAHITSHSIGLGVSHLEGTQKKHE
jgi:hypothetical protein